MLIEQVAAGLVLTLCVVIWLRMWLTPTRRHRLLAGPRRLWQQWRRGRTARREAALAIERARRKPQVEREGNVYRPKSFDRPRGDDDALH